MPKHPARRPPPLRVGDHLALDFLNSIAGIGDERMEWLDDGSGLAHWLEALGIAAREDLATAGDADDLDTIAAEARNLRDWLRQFVGRYAGAPLPSAALAELRPVNHLLAEGPIYRRIVAGVDVGPTLPLGSPSGFAWHETRRFAAPPDLLQPIAVAIGALVCDADFRLIRACEGSGCSLIFLDRTKAHARRWCSMALCGNRAKAAAHRARLRQRAGG